MLKITKNTKISLQKTAIFCKNCKNRSFRAKLGIHCFLCFLEEAVGTTEGDSHHSELVSE